MEDTFKGLLARYRDGELNRETAQTVEAHLTTCAGCRAELLALRALSVTLTHAPTPHPPADAEEFWRMLQPRLGAQQAGRLTWPSWLPGLLLLGLQGILGVIGATLSLGSLLRSLSGIGAGLPNLTLPGLLPLGALAWTMELFNQSMGQIVQGVLTSMGGLSILLYGALLLGVLYLIWLTAWWSRYQTVASPSHA